MNAKPERELSLLDGVEVLFPLCSCRYPPAALPLRVYRQTSWSKTGAYNPDVITDAHSHRVLLKKALEFVPHQDVAPDAVGDLNNLHFGWMDL